MAAAAANNNLAGAIRAMADPGHILNLLPEGDPSKSGFYIHDHIASTITILDRHLPLPAGVAYQAEVTRKRIDAMLSKMVGPARKAIDVTPVANFATMDATQTWLIHNFEGPHYEDRQRTALQERRQKKGEPVTQYIWDLKALQRNLNQHLARRGGGRQYSDEDLLSTLILNALPKYKKKLLAPRAANLEAAQNTMMELEGSTKMCSNET